MQLKQCLMSYIYIETYFRVACFVDCLCQHLTIIQIVIPKYFEQLFETMHPFILLSSYFINGPPVKTEFTDEFIIEKTLIL